MDNQEWIKLYEALVPLLGASFFVLMLCRWLMLWQKERTWRAFWFTMIYTGVFFVLTARSFHLGMATLTIGYAALVAVSIACNLYEWRIFTKFIQAKNAALAAEPSRLKLHELAEGSTHVALAGTETTNGK